MYVIAERENFHSKRSIEGKIVSEIVNDRVASIGELNAWSRSNDSTSAYAFPPPSLHRKFRGAKFCDSASFLINLNRKIAILLSDWNGFFMENASNCEACKRFLYSQLLQIVDSSSTQVETFDFGILFETDVNSVRT